MGSYTPQNEPRNRVLDSALDAIGCTPLIRLDRVAAAEGLKCNLYGKVEFFNPGESVKDRMAYRMIVEAEKSGVLIPGKSVLIETTAGNTGVGLAWIGLLKGYRTIFVMPERMSLDKDVFMRALGAEVLRAPNSLDKYRGLAERLVETIPNAVMLDQFTNTNNALAHELTTGPELIEAIEATVGGNHPTSGKIDAFFAGCGTGGTLAGVSRAVKKNHNPEAKIIACDPIGSLIARPEELNDRDAPLGIEGMGLKFVPETVEYPCIDQWVKVVDEDGYKAALSVHRLEGLLVGGSSGGVLAGALEYLKSEAGFQELGNVAGKNAICIFPDGIRNYLTKDWFTENLSRRDFQPFAQEIADAFEWINR